LLLPNFGVQGTVLIFSGIAMNAICCALLLQPVRWHTKKTGTDENLIEKSTEIECLYCQSLKKKSVSIFSSQYLHNADDVQTPGYEIIDPGFPMMAKANDGWYSSSSAKRSLYGSKMSLTSRKMSEIDSKKASNQNLVISTRPSYANLGSAITSDKPKRRESRQIDFEPSRTDFTRIEECPSEDCETHKSPQDLKPSQNLSVNPVRTNKTTPTTPTTNNPPYFVRQISETKYLKDNKSNRSMQGGNNQSFRFRSNTFNVEKEILDEARNKLEQYVSDANERVRKCTCEEIRRNQLKNIELDKIEEDEMDEEDKPKFTLWQKIVIFFDLDLLKDFTYLNIMIGITIGEKFFLGFRGL
jgi:hypothetical protein